MIGSFLPAPRGKRTSSVNYAFRLGRVSEPDLLVSPVEHGVELAHEHVAQDPKRAGGLRNVHAHDRQDADLVVSCVDDVVVALERVVLWLRCGHRVILEEQGVCNKGWIRGEGGRECRMIELHGQLLYSTIDNVPCSRSCSNLQHVDHCIYQECNRITRLCNVHRRSMAT